MAENLSVEVSVAKGSVRKVNRARVFLSAISDIKQNASQLQRPTGSNSRKEEGCLGESSTSCNRSNRPVTGKSQNMSHDFKYRDRYTKNTDHNFYNNYGNTYQSITREPVGRKVIYSSDTRELKRTLLFTEEPTLDTATQQAEISVVQDHSNDAGKTEISELMELKAQKDAPSSDTILEDCEGRVTKPTQEREYDDIGRRSNTNEKHFNGITKLLEQIAKERVAADAATVKEVECRVNEILLQHIQGCALKLYGSHFSGYAISTSDVNFELFTMGSCTSSKFLRTVSKVIEENAPKYHVSYEDAQSVKKCEIHFIEDQFSLSCVIRYLGPQSLEFRISKLLKSIIELDSRVKTLLVSFRHWAEVCSICDAQNAILSTLSLVIMVIYFLQRTTPPVLPVVDLLRKLQPLPRKNSQSTGELWLNLLKFYSDDFNWRDHVVSLTSHETVLKTAKPWTKCWIAIEDPSNPKVNLAKSVTSQDSSQYVQSCFNQSYDYFSSSPTVSPASSVSDLSIVAIDEGYGSECRDKHGEYHYSFNSEDLASKLNIPTECPQCEELGFFCDECADEDSGAPEPLPPMSDSFLKHIDDALQESYASNALDFKEVDERRKFVADLENYVIKRFCNAKLELIGSSANGFGFHSSDLDICMTLENKTVDEINAKMNIRNLRNHLQKRRGKGGRREFTSVFALYSAKVPLVQFVHAETGFRGDISLYNMLAVHNTELLFAYSCIDKRAKVLGCAMKLLAKNGCIADTAQKTLSSYSYILMVIHFLQRTNPPVLPALQELCAESGPLPENIVEGWNVMYFSDLSNLKSVWKTETNVSTVAELWLGLLKYYTEELDTQDVITIRQSKATVGSEPSVRKAAKLFNIVDPFILSKNLGRVMSLSSSIQTYRTLLRARKLFGTPIQQFPVGYKDFKEYFFDPMSLTDGRVMKTVECKMCGKLGHETEKCGRFFLNHGRGRGIYNNNVRRNINK